MPLNELGKKILQTHLCYKENQKKREHKKFLWKQYWILYKQSSLTCQQLKLCNISQGWSQWGHCFTTNIYLIFWKTKSWNECIIIKTVAWVSIIQKKFQKIRRMKPTFPSTFPNNSKGEVMFYLSLTNYLYSYTAAMVISRLEFLPKQNRALRKNLEKINKHKWDFIHA